MRVHIQSPLDVYEVLDDMIRQTLVNKEWCQENGFKHSETAWTQIGDALLLAHATAWIVKQQWEKP